MLASKAHQLVSHILGSIRFIDWQRRSYDLVIEGYLSHCCTERIGKIAISHDEVPACVIDISL